MQHIFDSLKVVELANVLAGPSVGQFFAELGAKVIKVENPATKGDVTRSWKTSEESDNSSVSAYFSAVNAGKTSVALDVKSERDQATLKDLIKEADLLISSYKPGDSEKLGLDYETLRNINPQLIYAEITGYGNDSPKVGYDAILQAETGYMFLNGEPGGESIKMPVALIDVLAAHHLKEAVLLAYIHRLKTNEGSRVSVSLFDAAVSSLVNQATNYLVGDYNPQKMGAEHPNIAPYGKLFTCADKAQIILAIGNDKQFKLLCESLNVESIANDLRFENNKQRVKNRTELNTLLQESIQRFDSITLLEILERKKVPSGRLNDIATLFQSKEAQKLTIKDGKQIVGLKNFVAKMSFMEKMPHITPPASFNSGIASFE
ncbi:CaiB/BaiF CoA-transferase family protein [Marivirga atlantica]|uniref:CoA transferase n=1 Tax=Marivirga atlantica TaxID=1548457 RepID=A0A937ANH1_9BACT|nr:CaiB/BaiF CoA-transferase family protein [Marivirga atlantica]MBL0766738.1 CoA transferase [Marivirga atlantica]